MTGRKPAGRACGSPPERNTESSGTPAARKPGFPRLLRAIGAAAAASLLASGCAPSVNVLGAYFPDWLFCIVTGVALAVAVYLALARLPGRPRPVAPALVYPTLVAIFASLAWLVFFKQ